jgi:CRISPR-associated protein Csb2
MRVVLEQRFILGRFHATPWRVNPFDDPYGEWPPSPWRLARAVVARLHQLARETGGWPVKGDELARALCRSRYSFYLPPLARRCPPIRQYHPTKFGWQPPSRVKKGVPIPSMRGFDRSLVQDTAWALPGDGSVLWFLDFDDWSPPLLDLLDGCLTRVVYFGRSESATEIRTLADSGALPEPNSRLLNSPDGEATVPILVPREDATLDSLEAVTDTVRARSLPPGARWMYATRPAPAPLKERRRICNSSPRLCVVQFALGVAVPPQNRSIVRLTNRFRGGVVRCFLESLSGGRFSDWSRAPEKLRERVSGVAGKDASGAPLQGLRHAHYLLWSDDGRHYTRLIAWRPAPFDVEEVQALLQAARYPIGWGAAGPEPGEWLVRLVPLPFTTEPPPGLDGRPACDWRSVTPFVPPRFLLRSNGRVREEECVERQLAAELAVRGHRVGFELLEERPTWVAVHHPARSRAERANRGDRRGYWLRMRFREPVAGPLILGHSATFGLGLFRPVMRE